MTSCTPCRRCGKGIQRGEGSKGTNRRSCEETPPRSWILQIGKGSWEGQSAEGQDLCWWVLRLFSKGLVTDKLPQAGTLRRSRVTMASRLLLILLGRSGNLDPLSPHLESCLPTHRRTLVAIILRRFGRSWHDDVRARREARDVLRCQYYHASPPCVFSQAGWMFTERGNGRRKLLCRLQRCAGPGSGLKMGLIGGQPQIHCKSLV